MLALLAVTTDIDPAIERAASYLLDQQLDDGSWDNAGWLHTMIPPDSFYSMDLPAKAVPLQALGQLKKRLAQRT